MTDSTPTITVPTYIEFWKVYEIRTALRRLYLSKLWAEDESLRIKYAETLEEVEKLLSAIQDKELGETA